MANDLVDTVTGILEWLEDLDRLAGNFDPFQPSDQFLCFTGKHGAADHFDPSSALCMKRGLQEHGGCKDAFFPLFVAHGERIFKAPHNITRICFILKVEH